MSDIKLFLVGSNGATELSGATMVVERRLQELFERNLEALLGVRFLASEFVTGQVHGGRIDTLGLDEDGSPVIIEYKRMTNENVMNQGLYYLDWLMDHRGDFAVLVQQRLGSEAAARIDWSGPRLLCIAGDFTRYDEHAVKQIERNIELIRYRSFDDGLLMIELVHNPRQARSARSVRTSDLATRNGVTADETLSGSDQNGVGASGSQQSQLISYRISQARGDILELFEATRDHLEALGDDVQVKEQKYYVAFKRIKNFACLEVYPQARVVFVHLKIDPSTVSLEEGFTRDMRSVGHFGTGDLQVAIRNMDDFRKAHPLFQLSYDNS